MERGSGGSITDCWVFLTRFTFNIPEAAPREAITQEDGSPQLDETGEQDYKWGINSQAIIVALVNAVKDQQAVIEQLKTRIDTLENN